MTGREAAAAAVAAAGCSSSLNEAKKEVPVGGAC